MSWRALLLSFTLISGSWAAEDRIRVGMGEWTTLNPLLLSQDTDSEAVDLLFDRLVTLDAKGDFIPQLLESWTILQGGREVVLKLRPGMTWHDGSPIEAEDLVFTWNALRLPRVRQIADTAGGLVSFDNLTAEGPLTVRIKLRRPRGTLLSDLYNFIPVPRHHYQVGAKPMEDPVNFRPVGSGPYRIVGVGSTTHALMERWPGYRGAHPGSAFSFELVVPPAGTSVVPEFEKERLHFTRVGGLRYYLVHKGAQGAGTVRAVSVPLASFEAFFLNCDPKRSLLGDLALRQAISELVPWKDMARAQRFFPTRLATSFWPPESWAYDPEPRALPQVSRAIAILDSAGWKLGPDGIRRDAKGRSLSLVAYEPAPSTNQSVAKLLAIQAAKAGVKIEVRTVSFPDVSAKASDHVGDIWSYGWFLALDPDVDSPLFTREGYLTKANVSSYLNPEMDRLFDAGRHTLDQAARKRIYLQISALIYRDKPIIPIDYMQARVLIHRRLQGVDFNRLGQSYGFWPGRRGWRLNP
ncbi:ABC transporter substrate-binding protein [Geothrix limicola]|uniref:ABC transporter substrate-binding protein n=1 Tax=Geothrix limicola TaxID=2927978 RepID=A0ABQ5QCZ6_9BACT|nr:ABC transporter substrate-binding protein [Geothrix limicola]GLH72537.1 ABC transporter substrate-binding protein [Geothrix limicola]